MAASAGRPKNVRAPDDFSPPTHEQIGIPRQRASEMKKLAELWEGGGRRSVRVSDTYRAATLLRRHLDMLGRRVPLILARALSTVIEHRFAREALAGLGGGCCGVADVLLAQLGEFLHLGRALAGDADVGEGGW